VFPAQLGTRLPEALPLSINCTSIPASAAAFKASATVASGMKKGDCTMTRRCAATIMEA
jgi:hypothetical protein